LTQVGKSATQVSLLNWVAETFYGMGQAFDTTPAKLTPEARKYYALAQQGFADLIDRARKQPGFANENLLVQIRLRAASCQRKLGSFAEAIKSLEALLKEKNTLVNVQVEAAHTYQDWGAATKDANHYVHAVVGGDARLANGGRVIWGWGDLSRRTLSVPQFRETFFEARYNLAICRFRIAMLDKDAAERTKGFEATKKDIRNVAIIAKDYGGDAWRPRFDRLLRDAQKMLKQPEIGLNEFAAPATPATAANKK
jgi:hypothetical protein